jgi:YVTN family beta-propeller protein
MMKTLLNAVVALLLISSAYAKGGYKQVATFPLPGNEGWDYLTYDSGGDRLFIAHGSTILVINASDGTKAGEIPAVGAHGTALVPDRNLGFSSNGRAGTVTVFDLKTLKPQQDIKVGENPDAIIYDPYSKYVLVMNGRSKDVMAIDPASLKVVQTVPIGGKLEFAVTTPEYVYVNVEDAGEIVSISTKNWKVDQHWKLEGCEEPSGLAIDEKAGRLFTVCGNAKMLVINTKTGKVVSTVPTGNGTDAAAFDRELGFAFASNGEGSLSVVQQAGDGKYSLSENVSTMKGARTMALDPSSHKVYLVTAEFGPPAEGQKRPSIKPGTFKLLVYAPGK